MSTSSTDVTLSVVVGSNGAPGSIETFLDTLAPQLDDDVEVLVCEPDASPIAARGRHPAVRFLDRPGALVPELWRDGIDAVTGQFVVLTISPMRPAADWRATVRRLVTEADAVGGAIDPAQGLRVRDWAEYLCRYAREMRPLSRTCAPISRVTTPCMRWPRSRRSATSIAPASGSPPLVSFLMTFRVLREVAMKRRHRVAVVVSLPLIFSFDVVWAVAEAHGHMEVLTRRV